MAADLHIHVLDGATEEDIAYHNSNTLGSKYFAGFGTSSPDASDECYQRAGNTPSVWIGEVSWLKAALFEEYATYVPKPIDAINDIIGEDLPRIDDDLIERIRVALQLENTTGYRITEWEPVEKFLTTHKGKQVYTISW